MTQIRNQQLLNKIGAAMKQLRENTGLTQEEVYNDTGIHIGRIETATTNISVSTLDALCKYFKIEMSTFLSDL